MKNLEEVRKWLLSIAALIGSLAAIGAIVVPIVLWFSTPAGIIEISSAIRGQGAAQQAAINKVGEAVVDGKYTAALGSSESVSMWRATLSDDIAKAERLSLIARSGSEYVITKGGENALGEEIRNRIQKAKALLLSREYYEAVAVGVQQAHLSDLSQRARDVGLSLPVLIGVVAGYTGTIRAEQ